MWALRLKPAIVNTRTCNFVSERSFQAVTVSRCSACWTWVWRSVWEVQCDEFNRAWCDACEAPAWQCFLNASIYPCGHRAMLLVLPSAEQKSEFDVSSQSMGNAVSAASTGFLLITNSRLSPASIIRGTVRQQSKSLVLTWFTWNIRVNEIIRHSTCYYIHIFKKAIVWGKFADWLVGQSFVSFYILATFRTILETAIKWHVYLLYSIAKLQIYKVNTSEK